MARASKCPCGDKGCVSWHVEPMAAIQGVSFTEEQAHAVAWLLNKMDLAFERGRLAAFRQSVADLKRDITQ